MSKEKVVLAYSGGLDTSVILKWLIEEKNCDVYTFTADLGQGEDNMDEVKAKALRTGAKDAFVMDLKEEFTKDYIFPMFRANALYEGVYLLGTSIARPLIALKQIEIAKKIGASSVSHGATGKGNDQVRFELGYYANMPNVKVIAPWREWSLGSRTEMLEFARKHNIEIPNGKEKEPPYSMDANLLHLSIEGKALEDTWEPAQKDTYIRVRHLDETPNAKETFEIDFNNGDMVAINGKEYSPAKMLAMLNEIGSRHGIGRVDLIENRFVGMKSRGIYETPGGTILLHAHRAMESITLDKGTMHLKDELMPKYAELIYNGFWFSGERRMLQCAIDESQKNVNGTVRLSAFKGNIIIEGRKSPNSLFNKNIVTFEKDSVYNQRDAEGFIKLNALRFRLGNGNCTL
jgi:argininosuccinate synthase